jgi:hypothetical protein
VTEIVRADRRRACMFLTSYDYPLSEACYNAEVKIWANSYVVLFRIDVFNNVTLSRQSRHLSLESGCSAKFFYMSIDKDSYASDLRMKKSRLMARRLE